jgi:chitinase
VYGAYPPSVTSKAGQDYPSYPASSTVTVVTTTYVDSCETGITTKTETITKTVCNKCQGDSVTSVYVCNNCGPAVVTYTLTKPATPATNVPVVPTEPAKPATPSQGSDKPSYPPTNNVPKKQEVPVGSTTVEIVYVTKTPVPVVPSVKHTPAPYPSAPANSYPVLPTGTGAGVPPTKPTGTGAGAPPTKPSSYVPPAQFTGAASHASVGLTGLLAVAAAFLVL